MSKIPKLVSLLAALGAMGGGLEFDDIMAPAEPAPEKKDPNSDESKAKMKAAEEKRARKTAKRSKENVG